MFPFLLLCLTLGDVVVLACTCAGLKCHIGIHPERACEVFSVETKRSSSRSGVSHPCCYFTWGIKQRPFQNDTHQVLSICLVMFSPSSRPQVFICSRISHYCLEHIVKSSVCAIYCQDRDSPHGWKIQAGKRFDDVHPIGCDPHLRGGREKVRACPMNKKLCREIMLLANGLLQSCMLRETLKLYAIRNVDVHGNFSWSSWGPWTGRILCLKYKGLQWSAFSLHMHFANPYRSTTFPYFSSYY